MDYGTDFLLTDDDVVFTSDGDMALVSGPCGAGYRPDAEDDAGRSVLGQGYWGLMLGVARKQDNKTAGPV
jgi:hypothetical protein